MSEHAECVSTDTQECMWEVCMRMRDERVVCEYEGVSRDCEHGMQGMDV